MNPTLLILSAGAGYALHAYIQRRMAQAAAQATQRERQQWQERTAAYRRGRRAAVAPSQWEPDLIFDDMRLERVVWRGGEE